MKIPNINRIYFTTILVPGIIKDAEASLNSEGRADVMNVDDSMFEYNRSKKVELPAKLYALLW